MTTATLRKQNQNFIAWDPVLQTAGQVLTSITSVAQMRAVYETSLLDTIGGQTTCNSNPVASAAVSTAAKHAKMVALAKKSAPDQSWFDEDVLPLRHPIR